MQIYGSPSGVSLAREMSSVVKLANIIMQRLTANYNRHVIALESELCFCMKTNRQLFIGVLC